MYVSQRCELTFTDETAAVIHDSKLLGHFVVHRLVLGEAVESQVFGELSQLITSQAFAKKLSYFFNLPSKILLEG